MNRSEWKKANADKMREYRRRWRERNREKQRESHRQWATRNPDYWVQRRSSQRGVPVTAQAEAWLPILRRDPCAFCGAPANTLDHIEPVAVGGDSDWDNLTAACRSCNASKARRSLLSFIAYRSQQEVA